MGLRPSIEGSSHCRRTVMENFLTCYHGSGVGILPKCIIHVSNHAGIEMSQIIPVSMDSESSFSS